MNDLLDAFEGGYRDRKKTGLPFGIPAVAPDRLTTARRRFKEADEELVRCTAPPGTEIWQHLHSEAENARSELQQAEVEELMRCKHRP